MGLIIEGGEGDGYAAGVTNDNRLKTSAVTNTMEHHVNHYDEQCYTLLASLTPTGAGDCFLYMKNNSIKDMIISEFMLYCASNEIFQFKLGDEGTPIGGADATLVNRNAGSGNEADVTAQTGVDITGMDGGSVVAGAFVKGGESSLKVEPLSGIIIPKNKILTGWVVTGTAAILVGLGVSFHPIGH